MIQKILESKLDVPADMFREAFYKVHHTDEHHCSALLAWASERASRNAEFARDLGLVPKGYTDDYHRLSEHLVRRIDYY